MITLVVKPVGERKGRGVFATQAFPAGYHVHTCNVILVPKDEVHVGCVISRYVYNFGEHAALALGFGSLFNHSPNPNLDFVRDFEGRTISYITTRAVRDGDELTIEYSAEDPQFT